MQVTGTIGSAIVSVSCARLWLNYYIFDITSPWALGYKMKTKALYAAALAIRMYLTPIYLVAQHEEGYNPSAPESVLDDKA